MNQVVYGLNKEGERLMLAGEYDEAKAKFQAAIDILEPSGGGENPQAAWAYAHLGEALRLLGDSGAKENFETAISRSKLAGKKNPYAEAHLGEYYRSNTINTPGNLQKARDHFTNAINANTTSPYLWAYAHRGAAYDFGVASVEDIEQALADFETAINRSEIVYPWAYAFRGGVYLYVLRQEKDIDKVRDYAERAWKDILMALAHDNTILSPHSPLIREVVGTLREERRATPKADFPGP